MRHFYKEAAGPKNRPGSFMRHSHGVTHEGLYETSLRVCRLTVCESPNLPHTIQAPGAPSPIKRLLEIVSRRSLRAQFQVGCVEIYVASGQHQSDATSLELFPLLSQSSKHRRRRRLHGLL